MKLAELERHLRLQGCLLKRQGGRTQSGKTQPIDSGRLSQDIGRSRNIWQGVSASNSRFHSGEFISRNL